MTSGSFRSHFQIQLHGLISLFRIRQIYFSVSSFHANVCYTPDPLFLSFYPYAPATLSPAVNRQLLVLKCHPAPRVVQGPPTFSHSLGTARRMAQCSSTALTSLNLYILIQAVRRKCLYCIITHEFPVPKHANDCMNMWTCVVQKVRRERHSSPE